jgi:copper chaperone
MQTFRVPDMTCGGCVRAITNAVKEADPAASVAAEVESHVVKIESALAAGQLLAVIQDAGFTPEAA